MENLNGYGDKRNVTIGNQGVDIAAQRADDLDNMALEHLRAMRLHGSLTRALDLASASGGQALRMAQAGADVVALDIDDYSEPFLQAAGVAGVAERCRFVQTDITDYDIEASLGQFDVIVCQRMIHYVPYNVAIDVVGNIRRALKPGGQLYLSASGLESELGDDYAGAGQSVEARYELLSSEMVEKHGMHGLVCLYTRDEIARLLEVAGMEVLQVFSSAFGNVKARAR